MKHQGGKPEERAVETDHFPAEPHAERAADSRRYRYHHEGELEIVPADRGRCVAERLELGDLLALKTHQSRKCGAGHEGGNAQEDDGKRDRGRAQVTNLVVDHPGGRVIRAVIGGKTAVRCQDAVEIGLHGADVTAGRHIHDHVVERTFQAQCDGQFTRVHPENPVAAIVGHEAARRQFVDVLGRQRNADDPQPFAGAVYRRVDGVAGQKAMGLGECAADHDLAPAAGHGETSRAQVEQIEMRGMIVGDGNDDAFRRLRHSRQIEYRAALDAGFGHRHIRDAGEPCAYRVRRALEVAEDIGQAMDPVISVLRRFK